MNVSDRTVGDHDNLPLFTAVSYSDTALGCPRCKSGTQRAQTTHHHRAFQSPDNPADERPGHKQRPNAGNQKERGTKQQAPNPPRTRQLAPVFHTVPGIVIADHVLIRVIVAANDWIVSSCQSRFLQFLTAGFGFDVRFENAPRWNCSWS